MKKNSLGRVTLLRLKKKKKKITDKNSIISPRLPFFFLIVIMLPVNFSVNYIL